MWLGDTATATRIAQHLQNIHTKVTCDVIDAGAPELGGYAANSPRDSMWAALTEMHSTLWSYEAFAFRDGKLPHRLPAEKRDQYMAESANYVRLFPAPEGEIPQSMSELAALYGQYADLFSHIETMEIMPDTGQNYHTFMQQTMKKNFHISQLRIVAVRLLQYGFFVIPVMGAVSGKTRRSMGISPRKEKLALVMRRLVLPLVWLMQQRPIDRYFMRLLWGPGAMILIDSARKMHKQARAEKSLTR